MFLQLVQGIMNRTETYIQNQIHFLKNYTFYLLSSIKT